ncbi:hypothetical protein Tco_0104917 [Tanacetum coccineum]
MENEHILSYETLTRVYLGSYEHYKSVEAEVEHPEPGFELQGAKMANEVLVTKGALQSEVGHLDMLEHEVGRLCDEYAWLKLTRRCWNTHVLAAAAIGPKGEMWRLNQPRNEENFDVILDEGNKILHSIEGTILEEEIFFEFDEFMAMTAGENSESESYTEEPPFEKITINIDYKIKTSLEEPLTDLELKHLPDNLEYIQLLDDKKPIVQKQRRLNPNMQEVVKKEIVKLLDTAIIYPIADSPWVSPIHYVPKKGGITVVTNENDKLVPTRTVTGWREKCHFMVKEGIVLGHKVSRAGIEVDKAKIDVISKLPPPTNIKVGAVLEFNIEIKDRKGIENVVVDHLSRIENEEISDDSEVDDNFPGETLMEINTRDEPCTAYKTPTGTTPYKLIYGKNCHLPFEIEHRAYWALKNCNPDLIAAGEKRMFQLHELDELRHQAYENSRLYKARTKVWHDRKLRMRKEFKHGNKVLLFHSKYKFKQPKLRSRWLGPYVVKHQYPSGYVELYGKDGKTFIVNGHRLKLYHEEEDYNDQREAVTPFFPKE